MNRFAEAIEKAQIDIGAKIVMDGTEAHGSGNVVNALLKMLLADNAGLPHLAM